MRLTSKQKADAALAVPCPVHGKSRRRALHITERSAGRVLHGPAQGVLRRSGDPRPEEEAAAL